MKKAIVLIADGNEDIETIVPIDLLRRAGIEVTVAGCSDSIVLSRGIKIIPDIIFSDVEINNYNGTDLYDIVILPGGMPGTLNLLKNKYVASIVKRHHQEGKFIAAICAAPKILSEFGILHKNCNVTSHPSVKDELSEYNYMESNVVIYRKIITSRGAGTSIDFALKIIEVLCSKNISDKIATDIIYRR
jgi:DJ-1 family protein